MAVCNHSYCMDCKYYIKFLTNSTMKMICWNHGRSKEIGDNHER